MTEPRCDVCGRAQSESFMSGDAKRKRQAVNHIPCANSARLDAQRWESKYHLALLMLADTGECPDGRPDENSSCMVSGAVRDCVACWETVLAGGA